MSRPRFKTRRTEGPGQDLHWQDVVLGASPTSSPLEGPPSDESPPRTISLCLAIQISASHDKSPPRASSPNSDWGVGHDTRHELGARTPPPRRVGDRFPAPCKRTSWRPMQAAGPDKSLNAGLLSCTTIPSPSPPTLPHASRARGTQAPPTTSSGLRLGLNVAS
jgi:hypothetical protein